MCPLPIEFLLRQRSILLVCVQGILVFLALLALGWCVGHRVNTQVFKDKCELSKEVWWDAA
jgi:hypothetical protein